jgi:hypothetical protein
MIALKMCYGSDPDDASIEYHKVEGMVIPQFQATDDTRIPVFIDNYGHLCMSVDPKYVCS